MKLVPKMTLAIVAAMTVVVVVYAMVSIRAHRQQLLDDTRLDNTVMATILADGVIAVHRLGGDEAARSFVATVDRHNLDMTVAWFSPTDTTTSTGANVAQVMTHAEDSRSITTEALVVDGSRTLGSVSIVDSLADEEAILDARVIRLMLTTTAMALLGVAIAVFLGRRYVARPVRALCDRAARIGRGQLQPPLVLDGSDELAELATAMNAMAEAIDASTTRAREEAEARISALEQLRHAERLATVGQLAAGIAHELGTPLNVVGARASMIEMGLSGGVAAGDETEDDLRRYAVAIREQAAKMAAIIRQLLGFARRQVSEPVDVDLGEVARGATELVRPLADRHHVRVLTTITSPTPALVRGDRAQLDQVVTNIVVNAIQACGNGGTVEVSLSRSASPPPPDVAPSPHGFIYIEVRDDGEGISAADLPRVFEPFFTTKDVGQGTGLGLSVAYGIVREHGGWIDAKSPEATGSTFTAHLPALGRVTSGAVPAAR